MRTESGEATISGMDGVVEAVHRSSVHTFSKSPAPSIRLVEGLGVVGDAHYGATVQHRSRVAADPSQPNLRQVHLIHAELLEDLREAGHDVRPGELGENITTRGLDLLGLPVGSRLVIGDALITVTGLRNPCEQINAFRPGLLKLVLWKDADGSVHRLAGVMGVVSRSGSVEAGQQIRVEMPPEPHFELTKV